MVGRKNIAGSRSYLNNPYTQGNAIYLYRFIVDPNNQNLFYTYGWTRWQPMREGVPQVTAFIDPN